MGNYYTRGVMPLPLTLLWEHNVLICASVCYWSHVFLCSDLMGLNDISQGCMIQ